MYTYKKIILYRIDEKAKKLVYTLAYENKETWNNITKDEIEIIDFDTLLRNITEFRNDFSDYEERFLKITDIINLAIIPLKNEINLFINNRKESNNLITRYYTDNHYFLINEERSSIDGFNPIKYFCNIGKIRKYNKRTIKKIREVLFNVCDFYPDNQNKTTFKRIKYDRVFIHNKDLYELFTIADSELMNFFYEFSFLIHNMNLNICNCNYCNKQFWGEESSVCCDNEDCQTKYQKDMINTNRRKKDNSTYTHYRTKLSNYLGQAKLRLPDSVSLNPVLISEFDKQRKVFTQQMDDKLEEYKVDKRQPDDELDAFYDKMKSNITSFCLKLKGRV